MRRSASGTAIALLALSVLALPAKAQPSGESDELKISLGGFALYGPEYEGSDEYGFRGYPLINLEYDRFFIDGRDGAGLHLIQDGPISLSASVGYAFGRDEDDSDDLRGLGDIDGGANAVISADVDLNDVALTARVSHQFTGTDTGTLIDLGAGYSWRNREGWFVRPGLSASYATEEYMQAYFGVSATQALGSGLAPYAPDAGFKSVGANLLLGYALDRHWQVSARASYNRLIGDAADSPIVQAENQFAIGLGVAYAF